jgi:asparagine synthase (glutamine-hydrolysing)
MSFFVFCDEQHLPALDRLDQHLVGVSRFTAQRFATNAGTLCLYGDQSGQSIAYETTADGDFIAVCGSLLYKGEAGSRARQQLLHDFSAETFAWQDLVGTHSVLLRKHGSLYLFSDGLGASRLYRADGPSLWSNSFIAMLEIAAPRRLDVQACYEYVIAGSVYGEKTLVEGVEAMPPNTLVRFDADGNTDIRQLASPIRQSEDPARLAASLDACADRFNAQLDAVFGPIAANYGDRLRLSFSGGFDSRLMLAMLMRHGARPTLFVYGNDADEDVRIARLISRAEHLELQCVDKSLVPPTAPEAFAEQIERNLYAFDGWKVEMPLFDFGADREDRLRRHLDGQVPLNGSLGEIYRNFFYMPDRPSSTGAVVSTFYSQYDPRAFTDRFVEADYRRGMQQAIRQAIGADSDRLRRSQVELAYPMFRGRFWTGRDAANNQRFGTMFFPFLEHAAIANTASAPIRFKDLGRLQGCMISRINPRLAAYPSDYGFALGGARPLKYRVKTFLGTQRPPALRKLSFRLTRRHREARAGALSAEYLAQVIDPGFPVMRQLFEIERLNSAVQYGLVATLEYLAQRYDLSPAPRRGTED